MPYTPRFAVSQDEHSVVISISVPHIRVSDAEVALDGRDFSFWCRPYLLNLTIPGELQQEDEEGCKAQYLPDQENGTIVVTLLKKNAGEHILGLDLSTTLLRPREPMPSSSGGAPTIELLSSESFTSFHENVDQPSTESEEKLISFQNINQAASVSPLPRILLLDPKAASVPGSDQLPTLMEGLKLNTVPKYLFPYVSFLPTCHLMDASLLIRYGFNRRHYGVFKRLQEELIDVIDASLQPDTTPEAQRRSLRLAIEAADFDVERFRVKIFMRPPSRTSAIAP
jgi:protein SHQ1